MSISNTNSAVNAQPFGVAEASQSTTNSVSDAGAPVLKARNPNPPTGWRDLPEDVLGRLLTGFLDQALATATAPGIRFEALKAAQQLGKVAKLENLVLHTELKYGHIDLQKLEGEIRQSLTKEWRSSVEIMADQQGKLVEDFAATRKMIASGAPLEEVAGHEGIHLNFAEVSVTANMVQFLSGLEGKTIKLDAAGIGKNRFIDEVLPALKKLPISCKVVLDASNNELTSDELGKLAEVMAMKPVIYHLDLSGNPLADGEDRQQAVGQLFRHSGPMTRLNLEGTSFDNTMAFAIQDGFSQAQCLERLDLRNNLLDEKGAIALINAVLPDPDDVSQIARLNALYSFRLGGNPYMGHEDEVRAAVEDLQNKWNQLKDAAYFKALETGENENTPSYAATDRIFEIYGPSADPQVNAFIRMYDSRAAMGRL
jgi:hypothetical protein